MSDILVKVSQIGLNTDFPIAGQNNSTEGFRQNARAILAGLVQATDELTRIQRTRFNFSGDAVGSSASIGSAVVSGNSDPGLEVAFTLGNVLSNPGSYNTDNSDYQFTFDAKGRLTAITPTAHAISWNNGLGPNAQVDISGSLGQGTGSLVLPVFTFNERGRLTRAASVAIPYGLYDQYLPRNSLVVGNSSNKTQELAAPNSFNAHHLVFDGANVLWKEIVETPVSTGTTTKVVGTQGIFAGTVEDTVTLSLDFTSVSPIDDIADPDTFVVRDITANGIRTVPFSSIKSKIAKVQLDSAPILGGSLDVGAYNIFSSSFSGLKLQSAATSPGSTLTLTQSGLTLNGAAGTSVSIGAPNVSLTAGNLLFNGIKFPTAGGSTGQVLAQGANGLEWIVPDYVSDPLDKVLFVTSTGNNTTGNGSMRRPFGSLTHAINQVPSNSSDLWTVVVMGGVFNENVTIQSKKRIAIEGLFGSSRTQVNGTLVLAYGVDELQMRNMQWKISGDTTEPILNIQSGLVLGTIKDCAFIRDRKDQIAISMFGQTTGPVRFVECDINGTVDNYLDLSLDGEVVFANLIDKLDKNIPIVSTTEERTLSLTDTGKYIRINNSLPNQLLVPYDGEVRFAVGATIRVSQTGFGRTSILPKSGVSINTPNGYVLRKRFSSAILTYVGQNIWDLSGDLDESIELDPVMTVDSDQITADSDQITVDNG